MISNACLVCWLLLIQGLDAGVDKASTLAMLVGEGQAGLAEKWAATLDRDWQVGVAQGSGREGCGGVWGGVLWCGRGARRLDAGERSWGNRTRLMALTWTKGVS